MRSLAFKETAFGLRSGSLAPNCGTTASSCSPRACKSRRIERFFCAKKAAAEHAERGKVSTIGRRTSEACGTRPKTFFGIKAPPPALLAVRDFGRTKPPGRKALPGVLGHG